MNQPVVFIHANQQQVADYRRWIQLADEPQDISGALCRWWRERRLLPARRFQPHPDPRQEAFFSLAKECLAPDHVSEDFVRRAVAARDVQPVLFGRVAACGDC
jgi:hypothetical protein